MKHFPTAKRLNQVDEYIFAKLQSEVTATEKRSERKVLNLGPGSPDIPPSQLYIEKLSKLIHEPGIHSYPGYAAIPEFSDAISQWYLSRFNVAIQQSEVLPLLGAKDGISHLPLALLNPGDEVLVPNPGYPAYAATATLMGAQPVYYDLLPENNFTLSIASIEKAFSKKSKCIWVNFPSNPTGHVASLEELRPVVEFCIARDLILLYDNAYSEITFDGTIAPSIFQIPGAKEVAVEIGSFSKSHSLAGFRMGWMVGNQNIVAALAKVKSNIDSGMPLLFQKLGAFALTHQDVAWHASMLDDYQQRRYIITKKLIEFGLSCGLPAGSLYIWAKIPDSAVNSVEFAHWLLHTKQILVTPGTAFGSNGERFIRASICSNISRIDQYV